MKRGLVLGALLLTACTTTKPAPPAPAPLPAPVAIVDAGAPVAAQPVDPLQTKESRQVAKTLKRVSELRGLDSTKAVPGVKLERDQLVGRIKDKALREFPPEALRREGDLLLLFGFAPPSFDYLGEMLKLLEAQLEGFYEPNNGTMYLAADLKGKEAEATLAHELVHALQDQHYDLKKRSTYRPGKSDETLALACLAEGDATSLMMDYVMAADHHTALDLEDNNLREMMSAGMETKELVGVPHILKSSLIAPYIDGLFFVHAARRKGGWPAVNAIWERTPTTTEQVLHYDKWEAKEEPIAVTTPTANALGAGWKLDDEDSMGELGFRLTYEEWMPAIDARKAAAEWGGDRSAIYTNGDQLAFAVHERFDPGAPKPAVWASLLGNIKKTLGKDAIKPAIDTPTSVCFERADFGPLMLMRKDREYVVIAGPAKHTGTTWTSASKCADAKTWATEVVANP